MTEQRASVAWDIVQVAESDPHALVGASYLFDEPVTPAGAEDFLSRPGHHVLLARDGDGRAVGFVTGVETCHPDKGTEMFIYELGVDEAARRRGVGRALLERLGDVARSRGCYAMWTATEADNDAALATYRSVGATQDHSSVIISIDDLAPEFRRGRSL